MDKVIVKSFAFAQEFRRENQVFAVELRLQLGSVATGTVDLRIITACGLMAMTSE